MTLDYGGSNFVRYNHGEGNKMRCPNCKRENPDQARFCNQCGQKLKQTRDTVQTRGPQGERKHVTILFSDLSGYTAMSERLDPEEVKEIMGDIFGKIAGVVDRYGGFVEKYIGDAVMAIFGVPHSHEDDPVRAIRAAMDIRQLVADKRPGLEKRIGQSLAMHSGVNTGLVVTGDLDLEKGTHGVIGDTVNVAARLSSIAGPDQIVVDQKTFSVAQGHFEFAEQAPVKLKGKKDKVRIYLVTSARKQPVKVHRSQGLRADFIGREAEMDILLGAFDGLGLGQGVVIEVVGEAGTGKSRLMEELKTRIDLSGVQLLEAHSYSYSQNVSYGPWAHLFRGIFAIEEGSPQDTAQEKLEQGISRLRLESDSIAPFIGGLLSITYPAAEVMSPGFFKEGLEQAVLQVLSSLARLKPTIFCFEDLHWADSSSLELMKLVFASFEQPALFICLYRPVINLLSTRELSRMLGHREIRIADLSPHQAQSMVSSILETPEVSAELLRFVQDKAGGNPFYLEEMVNSLVDTEVLVRDKHGLRLSRPIVQADVPDTVHDVIAARVDCLEEETKRILQEASVIGRSFLLNLLYRITELKGQLNSSIDRLEELDLIRYYSSDPDLEYIFKHALTQEVVYSGLLKKERRKIHQQIALAMETLFVDRLPELYETLAFHFSRSESFGKAADYLIKSGQKSLKLFALKEAHQFFSQAYDLISRIQPRGPVESETLIRILNKWASVFYFTGDVNGLMELILRHEADADQLKNKAPQGMFYAWFGWALGMQEQVKESFEYLYKALAIGERTDNQLIIGYACNWLVFSCFEELLEGLG